MNATSRFPTLHVLFGAYFHQDWPDYGSSDDVIDSSIEAETRETVGTALRELNRLLSATMNEAELAAVVLKELDCCYDPRPTGEPSEVGSRA